MPVQRAERCVPARRNRRVIRLQEASLRGAAQARALCCTRALSIVERQKSVQITACPLDGETRSLAQAGASAAAQQLPFRGDRPAGARAHHRARRAVTLRAPLRHRPVRVSRPRAPPQACRPATSSRAPALRFTPLLTPSIHSSVHTFVHIATHTRPQPVPPLAELPARLPQAGAAHRALPALALRRGAPVVAHARRRDVRRRDGDARCPVRSVVAGRGAACGARPQMYRVGPFALWGCAGRGLYCSRRRPIHAFSGRQATVPDTGTAAWPLEAVPATWIAHAASDSTAALSVRIVRGRCRCNLRALTRQAGCRHRGRCKQPPRTCWWRGQAAAAGTGVACCRVLHAAQQRRATSSSRRPC